MFNVNLTYIINWLLPSFLRGSAIKGFIGSLVCVIQGLFNQLRDYRTQKSYELHITSQVMYLEHILNTTFDPGLRRIYIDEYYESVQTTVFNKSETEHPPYIFNKSEQAGKIYLYNKSETSYNYYFIVWVPLILYFGLLLNNYSKLNRMKALLNKHKAYGTFYIIKPF